MISLKFVPNDSIDPGHGLVPKKWQAITTWTNVEEVMLNLAMCHNDLYQ